MSQIRQIDDAVGGLFSVEGNRAALADEIEAASYLSRLRAIAADGARDPAEAVRALLRLGTDELGGEQGHLARIDVADGTHTITDVSKAHPVAARGETRSLGRTYCRTVLARTATLALRDAPAEGWGGDPAYEEWGVRTYLGTRVVVDGAFYGTLCLVGRGARAAPFTEAEVARVGLLAEAVGQVLSERTTAHSQPTAAQLDALFEHSPNMINIHDADGNLIAPNPQLCEKTGYTEAELTGMKVWELDREATAERARTLWAEMGPGERSSWEGTYRRKDGTTFPVEVDLRCIDVGGRRCFIATSRDITNRKKTEAALREDRDLLNRTFETSPAAIAVLNTEGAFVEVSDRAKDVLGLDKSEVTARTYDDPAWRIRGPEGGPMPDADLPFARVMATGEPVYDVEHRIVGPDGRHRLLSVSGAPLRSSDGELEGVVFHLDDITEQRAAKQALRKERDRFATLFHNLPTPVVQGRPDEEGQVRIEAVNERFEDVFGYEEGDIQGEDLQALIVPEDETDGAEAMRERLLAGIPINREVRRRAADGCRDFQVQVALRTDSGAPAEGFAIYTDVTERKEQERTLARRKARLEAQAEATLDGLLVVDTDRHAVFFNDRFLEIWKLPMQVRDRDFRSSPPTERELLQEADDLLPDSDLFWEEVEYLYDHVDTESRDVVRLTDGRWLDRYSAPIIGDTGKHFGRLWVFRDVTEQREMVERLLEVQEDERRRIDQEIHDEMGGLLTSLQFTVDLARRAVQDGNDVVEHFDQLEALVSELSTVSRTISRKLYPSALTERGLAEAFPDLIDELETGYDLHVDLYSEIEPGDRFSAPIERTVYWIVQEILMSVVRRDDVDEAQVIANRRGEQLYLHFFDEGAGLAASTQGNKGGFRFEAIRRRVEWLGGEVRIDPIPDEGTRLSVILPVRNRFPVR